MPSTKVAWAVKRSDLFLLPELYEHLNPMPYEAADGEGFGGGFAPGRLHGHGRALAHHGWLAPSQLFHHLGCLGNAGGEFSAAFSILDALAYHETEAI